MENTFQTDFHIKQKGKISLKIWKWDCLCTNANVWKHLERVQNIIIFFIEKEERKPPSTIFFHQIEEQHVLNKMTCMLSKVPFIKKKREISLKSEKHFSKWFP